MLFNLKLLYTVWTPADILCCRTSIPLNVMEWKFYDNILLSGHFICLNRSYDNILYEHSWNALALLNVINRLFYFDLHLHNFLTQCSLYSKIIQTRKLDSVKIIWFASVLCVLKHLKFLLILYLIFLYWIEL